MRLDCVKDSHNSAMRVVTADPLQNLATHRKAHLGRVLCLLAPGKRVQARASTAPYNWAVKCALTSHSRPLGIYVQ